MRTNVAILAFGLVAACGSVSETKIDASIDTPTVCVPETDVELCSAASGCERRTFTDKCGMSRQVDCGACTGAMGCVVGTCKTPLCGPSFTYTSAPFPNMSRSGVEDSIGGATPDAQVILYVQTFGTSGCGNYHLIVADEVTLGSGTYTQRDVATTFTNLGLFNGQDGYTITADGLTIIAMTADRKAFKATKRSAINMVDFGAASDADFVNINMQTMGNSSVFRSPTLSADGLEFWYSLLGTTEVPYFSVRASTSVPFPASIPAPAPVSTSATPSGISADRLALFIWDGSFQGKIFTRKSTSDPFTNPNAPAAPPAFPGWADRPIANCTKLVGMTSPGGCANEDVTVLTRQ